MNLLSRDPLVLPEVQLHEIRLHLGRVAETLKPEGLPRALQGAREQEGKGFSGQDRFQQLRSVADVLGLRNVRQPRVLPAEAPLGLA